ncbi:ATP-grasp domain-containing protein [Nitrosomonas europaea]|uniref:ATP-grasp domain-containing protein n=1 Tax=Nitrosomonas europaea TaxID=915 RepID=UPI0032653512
MKRALLVGSSFSAAPIFFLLKKRGLHVSVCGRLETDPCHQYADASFYIDYSDREALLRLVESEKFDFVIPTCNDYSYMSCAWFAERLGYPGFDNYNVALIIHTKNEFRRITQQYNVPAPRASCQKTNQPINVSGMKYPLLVKPIDSFSGRGVTKVLDTSELENAIDAARQASRSGEIVLEEFVDGALHSHSAFIHNREIVVDFFVDEFCTVYPYQVNCSNHPSQLTIAIQSAVRTTIARLVKQLDLQDGLLHTQFIANSEQYWVIECMRRCPGDLYGNLIERSTGVSYMDFFVRPFLSEIISPDVRLITQKPIGRHTISVQNPMPAYTFSHTIPAVNVHITPLKSSGERLKAAPFDKLAILFAEYADETTMLEVTPHLAELVSLESLEEIYLDN